MPNFNKKRELYIFTLTTNNSSNYYLINIYIIIDGEFNNAKRKTT